LDCIILAVLIVLHLFLILMHKSLGMYQFGSRYTVDILPAALLFTLFMFKNVFIKPKTQPDSLYDTLIKFLSIFLNALA